MDCRFGTTSSIVLILLNRRLVLGGHSDHGSDLFNNGLRRSEHVLDELLNFIAANWVQLELCRRGLLLE